MEKASAVLLTFLLCVSYVARAERPSTNYYINHNSGSDHNTGTSKESAWKSLKNLSSAKFLKGDSILFSKGSSFKGGFTVKSSGTLQAPIVFASYGSGKSPLFTNPDYSILNGNVIQVHGSYIEINGLEFTSTANYTGKMVDSVNKMGEDKKILLIGAIYQITGAHHLTVKNCEFIDCPIAVYV